MNIQFVPHREYSVLPLERPTVEYLVWKSGQFTVWSHGTQIHLADKMQSQSGAGQRSTNFWPLKFVNVQAEQRYKCLTKGKCFTIGETTGTITSYERCSSMSNDWPMNSLDMGMSPAGDSGRTMYKRSLLKRNRPFRSTLMMTMMMIKGSKVIILGWRKGAAVVSSQPTFYIHAAVYTLVFAC
jgi:hypothetical protein